MADADYIVIGSGINALVAAALLGRKGHKVLVLERNARAGGCMLTDAITAPGFLHDVMATTFVLFTTGPAYAALGADLTKRGLEFAQSDRPAAVLRPDGGHRIMRMDRTVNLAAFGDDGPAYGRAVDGIGADADFIFGLLGGNPWSRGTAWTLARQAIRRGPRGLATFFGEALGSARTWLETDFQSDLMWALLAPWVLHVGLGPESAYSGMMLKVIAFALEVAGAPIVKGGAANLVSAFQRLIEDQGGSIHTGTDVAAILLDGGKARGVRVADGREITAAEGVISSTTPQQLYTRLLDPAALPASVAEGVRRFRFGKGNMQIHYALSGPPQWRVPEIAGVALTHLTPGLDGVSRAANEAERGLLPAEPTICVGQPAALDPSRCPPGRSILWLQLPETPRQIKGDAASEIATPADGRWTDDLGERYADRVEAILAHQIDGFSASVLGRRVYAPSDLEALNINLIGGDPYGGFCGIDQFFLWRPFKDSVNHRTHIKGLYHIGASTHPGPGLSGGSGFLLANSL
ncbi:MAG TPA: NAD(P)/FAD-dependent oxidoreductase [Stellaceae bacterium]